MASVGTQNSSMALTFNDVKERFHAKISLPTFVRPIFNTPASPLRATAPAFAPETTTAPEFPPGLTPKKFAFANAYNEQASCGVPFYAQAPEFVPKIATGNNVESKSPSLSIATTANATTDISSILSTTSLTWKDEQTLEDIIGHNDTNKLLNRFDPNAKHLSRGMLKTCAVSSSYDRKLLHEVIERVWSGRLTHETDRQDDCMYIWLPGTRVPKWLHRLHLSRKSKNTANQAVEQSPADPVSQKATAPAVREARPEAAVWNSFAKTENIRYAKAAAMSGPEYAAAEAKKYTENGITQPAPGRQHNFHETFKQTGTLATNDKLSVSDNVVYDEHLQGRYSGACAGTVTAPAEPRKAVLPPHLRAKALTAQKVKVRAGDSESDSEDGVWVAARLPSPCSSD